MWRDSSALRDVSGAGTRHDLVDRLEERARMIVDGSTTQRREGPGGRRALPPASRAWASTSSG
jgi:hypothetical protein